MTSSHDWPCPARHSIFILFSLALLALSLLLPSRLPAQSTSPQPGNLTGQVLDPTGALIPGATLQLSQPLAATATPPAPRTTQSGSDGKFDFNNVPAGTYQLTVDAPGFAHYFAPDITITPRQHRVLNLTMAIATQQQQVNVTGTPTNSA